MIYLVAPNAVTPSGGVGVAAHWVRLLIEHGYEAMFITPNGDPSPYWLNFTVPSGSYADMVDEPGNKRVDIWMDCMVENPRKAMQGYFFAQDACQLEHIKAERGGPVYLETLKHLGRTRLITLTHHAHWYYLYRYGLPSKVVNNFIDTDLFKPGAKDANAVAMIDHRDHFNPEIAEKLKKAGFTVKIARGTQAEIAQILAECLFFVSDVRGRWDGFEYSEGMPMPIMEAMAAGCIVLCRDTNGVREFIMERQSGFFYENDEMLMAWLEVLKKEPVSRGAAMATAAYSMNFTFTSKRVWHQIQEALELK